MRKIAVNEPDLSGNERDYLNECIDSRWISSEGQFVKQFEIGMAKLTQREYAIAVANGSVALDTAMLALEIGVNDEVIMPTFTIISCAAAIVRVGAKPILVDADPDTWNMDIEQIEKKITSKTKAIMVVHIYGLPVDMNPILALAKKYGLYVIEDAAEMHGQTCRGIPCGAFGDISTFSFYPNKHVTCGEGGMVLTNNAMLAERCKKIRNLFFDAERKYIHQEIGYNFRMTNLQAAVGVAQLERISQTIEKKRWIGRRYTEFLSDIREIQLPKEKTEYAQNIYWVYGIVISEEKDIYIDDLMKKLGEKGIGTRHFFWCMHEQPALKKRGLFLNERYPIAEKLARKGFYLPSGITLEEEDIRYVTDTLKKVIQEMY